MRVAQSWLTEILRRDTPDWGVTAEELDAGFVRVGFEVEEVDSLDTVTGPLKIGRVAHIEELTNFRKPIRFCQVDVGEAEPRGIVQIVHGLGEHSRRYLRLITALLDAGFVVAADDHAGHGATAAAEDTWGDAGAEARGRTSAALAAAAKSPAVE